MPSLFVQAVDDFKPLRDELSSHDVEIREHPAHMEFAFERELVVRRDATGLRHALWYSCVAALQDARVVQHDKHELRLVADDG